MSTFQPPDLLALEELLGRASAVVPMEDIANGRDEIGVIGLRHDVDDNAGSFATALRIAEWERERGFHATFFVLHTASYWTTADFHSGLEAIAQAGHEIGLHVNALAESLRTGSDPADLVEQAVMTLRGWGHSVRGVVAHGDSLCHAASFVNDELFRESARPSYGDPDRRLEHGGVAVSIRPVARSQFGFDYDPNWLTRAMYLSDSGGQWNLPIEDVREAYDSLDGQLHILWHSDWWSKAL